MVACTKPLLSCFIWANKIAIGDGNRIEQKELEFNHIDLNYF
jgi:hypothetical protein